MVGCAHQNQNDSRQPSTPSTSLRVGLSGDYPPFCESELSPPNALGQTGLDPLILRQLAGDQGWQFTPVKFAWPELSGLMQRHEADLAACGITIRRDRALQMAFTRPYAVSSVVVVVRPALAGRFPDQAALNQPGVKLLVNAGGHLEKFARKNFHRADIQTTKANRSLRASLDAGMADAVVSDIYEASRWPDLALLGPFSSDLKAFAVPLDQLDRRDALNEWLAAHEQNGWLSAQRRSLTVKAAELTPARVCAESLASAIELRFSLMPYVAAVKQREGIPISDPVQERAVIARARNLAAKQRLSSDAASVLFGRLIELAKIIQSRTHEMPDTRGLTLPGLRLAVAAASDALLPEIRRCEGVLVGQEHLMGSVLNQRVGDLLTTEQIGDLLKSLPPIASFSLGQ